MSRPVASTASFSFAIALLWSSAAAAQGVADAERHYDARIDYNAAFIASQRVLPRSLRTLSPRGFSKPAP